MENKQQYLNPETYIAMIQDLSANIANLNVELSLAKAQYKEIIEYAKDLQQKLENAETESIETVAAEVVDAHE